MDDAGAPSHMRPQEEHSKSREDVNAPPLRTHHSDSPMEHHEHLNTPDARERLLFFLDNANLLYF
ncbi:hypothetical protein AN958_00016 [Leucoagaricus sp. SymC.cos]|nr:hypothetical protein AN958_00016 [Leucoagaricus sp. SymC.cos]